MPNYQEIKLYKGEVKILFDEINHAYYRETESKKERLIGVTTLIGVLDKPALIPWAVGVTVEYIRQHLDRLQEDPRLLLSDAKAESDKLKTEAADIGTRIHAWIENHIKGIKQEMPEDERVIKGVVSFLNWEKENKVEYLESERLVYSKHYGYAGIIDVLARINGNLYLLDIKTGNSIYAEVKLQTAAYQQAYEEETNKHLKGRIVLRLSKETEEEYNERVKNKNPKYVKPYKVFESVSLVDDLKDLEAFVCCLNLYRWKQQAEKQF